MCFLFIGWLTYLFMPGTWVERNYQDILSTALPPWSLQSSLHPCRALLVQTYQKYCHWNVWWKYNHTSFLVFDDATIHNWTNMIFNTIPYLHAKVLHSVYQLHRCSQSLLSPTSSTQEQLVGSLHQKSDLKMWIICRHWQVWTLANWMRVQNSGRREITNFLK